MTEKRIREISSELSTIYSLLKLVDINLETGIVTWSKRQYHKTKVGQEAGCARSDRYRQICHKDRLIMTHRLVFYYAHGYLPAILDHKNRISLDNRICNLREATHQENLRNKGVQKNNTSGVTGVGWHKSEKRWRAHIGLKDGKSITLGQFKDKEEAIAVRRAAEIKYFGDFAPTNIKEK